MNNILINRINEIQQEYLKLLEKLVYQMDELNQVALLDELQVFWAEKYYIIELYLLYYSNNTYVFTGASYVDIDSKDHYPFMLLGKQHIFDDPIMHYAYTSKINENSVSNLFIEQIIKSAKDTINVIREGSECIIILPMRWTNQWEIPLDEMQHSIESTIISMFDDSINSKEELFQRCRTIKDIQQVLLAAISLGTRDIGLPLEEKFNRAWEVSRNYLEPLYKTDIERFYHLTYGLIHQSMEIMVFTSKYMVNPYIRNFSTFCNFSILARNIKNNSDWDNIIKRTTMAFLLHEQFDRCIFENISFDAYIKIIQNNNLEKNVLEKTKNIPSEKLSLIEKVIKEELLTIYKLIDR